MQLGFPLPLQPMLLKFQASETDIGLLHGLARRIASAVLFLGLQLDHPQCSRKMPLDVDDVPVVKAFTAKS